MTHFIEVTEEAHAALQPARPSGRLEVVRLGQGKRRCGGGGGRPKSAPRRIDNV